MPSLSIALQDFPWLSNGISRTPLQWSNGQTYELLLTSMYVRINNLGIQWCVMYTDPVLNMSTAPFLHFLSGYYDQHTYGWKNFPCFPSRGVLFAAATILLCFHTLLCMFPFHTLQLHLCPQHAAHRQQTETSKYHHQVITTCLSVILWESRVCVGCGQQSCLLETQ
jgi:hypothetical protein